jgi:hypothetical protein
MKGLTEKKIHGESAGNQGDNELAFANIQHQSALQYPHCHHCQD